MAQIAPDDQRHVGDTRLEPTTAWPTNPRKPPCAWAGDSSPAKSRTAAAPSQRSAGSQNRPHTAGLRGIASAPADAAPAAASDCHEEGPLRVVSINTPLEADSGTQPCHKPCRSHRRIARRRLGLDSANSVRELQVECSARPPARFLRVCLSIACVALTVCGGSGDLCGATGGFAARRSSPT